MLSNRFRWVYCQLEALRHCLPPSVQRILEELPETLDETYERVLREINKANREYAHRLLQCLTVALRPLRVEELAEVLAIDFNGPAHGGIPQLNGNWRWTDHHQAVLSTCSSLIAIVEDGYHQVVQFSHFSVKEFLMSDRLARSSGGVSRYHIALGPAHTIVAQACLGVLLRLDDGVDEDNVGDIPLAKYASRHLFDHAGFEDVASHIRDAMKYFFDADKPHWIAWSRVQGIDEEWKDWFTTDQVDDALPLYYASLGGFYDLAEHLVGKHPEHVNARGGLMVTPFVAALRGKHFKIVELLHRHGADANVRGGLNFTLLEVACYTGTLDIVEWLLNHGADVNTQDDQLWTPLHNAACNGRFEIIRALIEHNADIYLRDEQGQVPLHQVADLNHFDSMQFLLEHGADPNARDDGGSTPLHYLSWFKTGDEGTRLLLKHGAIIDAEDNKGRTPLQLALQHGSHDVAACLVGNGATR